MKTKILEVIDCIDTLQKRNDALLDILKKLTDQVDKHFYSLPEENENDGKYWKRLYDRACEVIEQTEVK